jgi:uncharacterized protein YjiK
MTTILLFLFLSGCFSTTAENNSPGQSSSFPYQLDQPSTTYELPESLKEISGLSLAVNGDMIAAINDEEGVIYLLDKKTGQLNESIGFREEGDYEGIEIVGNDAWVIKSSGKLYQVKDYRSESRQVVKYDSFLNKENDVEGLGYDPQRNSLLIGCKGKSLGAEDPSPQKAIYEFNLDSRMMMTDPVYLLTLPDIQKFLEHLGADDHPARLQEEFSSEDQELKFSPSGMAVHPLTGDLYVTSSKGKMLLVLSPKGEILHLVKLKKSVHAQPEGICFDQEGTLYIANEGKEDKARIYKFHYRN